MALTILFFRVFGIGMIGNGAWMIFSALGWFSNIPADMVSTGLPNNHLIHDVGIAYVVFGIGLEWCGRNIDKCRPVLLGTMFFLTGHAFGHAIEIIDHQLPSSHWWIDFPLVFLPGIILGYVAIPQVWNKLVKSIE